MQEHLKLAYLKTLSISDQVSLCYFSVNHGIYIFSIANKKKKKPCNVYNCVLQSK